MRVSFSLSFREERGEEFSSSFSEAYMQHGRHMVCRHGSRDGRAKFVGGKVLCVSGGKMVGSRRQQGEGQLYARGAGRKKNKAEADAALGRIIMEDRKGRW